MMQTRSATVDTWAGFNGHALYGVKPAPMVGRPEGGGLGGPETVAGATIDPGTGSAAGVFDFGDKPWHPDSPMFWFGVIAAATFGLVFVSTSFRVGSFRAGFSAGKE